MNQSTLSPLRSRTTIKPETWSTALTNRPSERYTIDQTNRCLKYSADHLNQSYLSENALNCQERSLQYSGSSYTKHRNIRRSAREENKKENIVAGDFGEASNQNGDHIVDRTNRNIVKAIRAMDRSERLIERRRVADKLNLKQENRTLRIDDYSSRRISNISIDESKHYGIGKKEKNYSKTESFQTFNRETIINDGVKSPEKNLSEIDIPSKEKSRKEHKEGLNTEYAKLYLSSIPNSYSNSDLAVDRQDTRKYERLQQPDHSEQTAKDFMYVKPGRTYYAHQPCQRTALVLQATKNQSSLKSDDDPASSITRRASRWDPSSVADRVIVDHKNRLSLEMKVDSDLRDRQDNVVIASVNSRDGDLLWKGRLRAEQESITKRARDETQSSDKQFTFNHQNTEVNLDQGSISMVETRADRSRQAIQSTQTYRSRHEWGIDKPNTADRLESNTVKSKAIYSFADDSASQSDRKLGVNNPEGLVREQIPMQATNDPFEQLRNESNLNYKRKLDSKVHESQCLKSYNLAENQHARPSQTSMFLTPDKENLLPSDIKSKLLSRGHAAATSLSPRQSVQYQISPKKPSKPQCQQIDQAKTRPALPFSVGFHTPDKRCPYHGQYDRVTEVYPMHCKSEDKLKALPEKVEKFTRRGVVRQTERSFDSKVLGKYYKSLATVNSHSRDRHFRREKSIDFAPLNRSQHELKIVIRNEDKKGETFINQNTKAKAYDFNKRTNISNHPHTQLEIDKGSKARITLHKVPFNQPNLVKSKTDLKSMQKSLNKDDKSKLSAAKN